MDVDLYDIKYFQWSKPFQKNKQRIRHSFNLIKSYNPTSVLDVGCGLGGLVWALNRNKIRAMGVDFSPALKDFFWKGPYFVCADARSLPFPDQSFDLIFSTDFFEHIKEKDVDLVLSEMRRVGKRIVAVIAEDLGGIRSKRQSAYHCTNKPLDWWRERLVGVDVFSSHIY